MRISFDLDGTLFVSDPQQAEPGMLNFVEREKVARLRKGTRELMTVLAEQGWEIWFYTNSLRPRTSLLAWASRLGMPVSGVVNQQIHENRCAEMGLAPVQVPAKMPRWFGIDLHVDDSPEVAQQISGCGGRVCLISESDLDWAEKVLSCADVMLRHLVPTRRKRCSEGKSRTFSG